MSRQNEILFILFSSFIVVTVWVGFNIIHASKTSTINDTLTEEIVPIQPTFDKQTIIKLKRRTPVQPLDILPQIPTSTGQVDQSLPPQASPSSLLEITPTITENQSP